MTTWFLTLAIKATLLLIAVAGVAAGVRRSPAATRHFVWLSGLAALLFLPFFAVTTPAWSPARAGDWLPAYLLTDAPAAGTPAVWQVTFADAGSSVMAQPDAFAEFGATASDIAGSTTGEAETAPNGDESSINSVVPAPMSFWLAFAWAGGAVAMLCWLAVGFVRRARLAQRAVAVDGGRIADAGDIAARSLGLRRRVRLLLGDSRVVPMTWGIVRPVLFLPVAAEGWSTRRLHAVLLHELAHIKRHDSLSRSLAQLACSVFWFHPLAWVSAGRLLREQESACDDVVILAGANPHHYAETLVAIAREFRSPRPSVVGTLAFVRRSNLEHRLLSILDPLRRRKKLSPFRKAVVLVLFVGVALPLAALHPAASAQEPDAVQRADQQNKPRPKVAVIVKRAAAPRVQVGVVVPRADAPRVTVDVLVPRADPPRVTAGAVVPRAEVATTPASEARSQRARVRRGGASSRIRLEAEGAIRIAATVADVELAADGWLVLTEMQRRLEIRQSGGGGLDLTYSVDGAVADFDDEARQWADEIFEHMAEMGSLRGNVFVSMSRAEISGELAPVVFEPFEFAFEPFDLETLELAIEPLELAAESFALAFEPFDLETLELAIEPLELAAESFAMTFEPFDLETLELAIEPLELAAESFALAIDPLELALELPFAGDRLRRFDRVDTWSEGGSRFVAMRRGAVALGETADEIEVGASGELVIDERSGDGVHRRLLVFAGEDGETIFEWLIDGEATAFDAGGRAWLQPILDWLNGNSRRDSRSG